MSSGVSCHSFFYWTADRKTLNLTLKIINKVIINFDEQGIMPGFVVEGHDSRLLKEW